MAIQVRRGNEVNFDPNKMLPGEWAVSLDTKYVRMCFSPGVCVRMATYEGFEEDMARIEAILEEAESIEEAIEQIQTEINTIAIEVENYAKSAEQSALEAKEYAEAAAESADKAEAITGPVVSGLKGSAETDYRTGQVTITPENLGLGEVLENIETLTEQMHEYKPPSTILQTVDAITEFLDNTVIPTENNTWYRSVANLYVSYPAFGTGGRMYIEGFRATNVNQWQTASIYNQQDGKKVWSRSKIGTDAWTEWKKLPSDADLANYLPLDGGTMTGNLYTKTLLPSADVTDNIGYTNLAYNVIFAKAFSINKGGKSYGDIQIITEGTEEATGTARLMVGNITPRGTAGNARGVIVLPGVGKGITQITPSNNGDSNIEVLLPSSAGTLALKSDITALNVLTEVEQTTVAYFIDYIFSNLPVSTTTIYSSTFLYNGHCTYSGIKPVDNYASFIIHGYGIRAIHMQLQNGVWVYSAMDNK